MAPDPLAAKLNDLAVANSEGLLNDDEYRLLRQNLFERYSSTGGIDIVSVSPAPAPKSPPRRKHVELVDHPPFRSPQPTPTRSKMSGMATLLRRATGRKPQAPPPPAPNVIKLSIGARMFSKKHEDASSSDTESSLATRTSSGSGSRRPETARKPSGSLSPTSPSRPKFDLAPAPTSPSKSGFAGGAARTSKYDVVPGGSNDIFDDENLHTSAAIRDAISAVEAECKRLVTAFNDLETSAIIRYRQENPQRTRSGSVASATPSRRPISPLPPPSSTHTKNRSHSNSQRNNTDGQSVRSSSSLRTTKSTASLFQGSAPPQSTPPPASNSSSWGGRLSSLRRKGSVSSLASSQNANTSSTSFLSVGHASGIRSSSGLGRSSSVSVATRSASHLPLPGPTPASTPAGNTMMELLNNPAPQEGGEELAEVRRRRAEMVGRCEARLDYLRVRLRTAELHEKLLRK